jgi:threonine dehydratase
MTINFEDVERAAKAIAGNVPRTPFVRAYTLSGLTGANVMLKLETLQTTNAFKVRGALNKLLSLTPDECKRGVIALSAGNHAQAVAYHATQLGITATIVMPETTPWTKVERTRHFGGTVELAGETLAEARDHLNHLIEDRGLLLVHPYNDPLVMAGQGTIALEMLADAPDLDTLIIPIGGGGLISGMAVAAREIKPEIEIIGVELERYPSMHAAINNTGAEFGGSTLAEGIAVRDVSELAVDLYRDIVDDIVLVGEAAVGKAVATLLSQENCWQKVPALPAWLLCCRTQPAGKAGTSD